MNIRIECFGCITKQILGIVEKYVDEPERFEVVQSFFSMVGGISKEMTPPELTAKFFSFLREKYDLVDPYKHIKIKSNSWVKDHLDQIKKQVMHSENPIQTALFYSARGNIIDYGVPRDFDIKETLKIKAGNYFELDHSDHLIDELSKARTMLLIGDNAGEIGFDSILLDQIGRNYPLKMYYMVRGGPILNDATEEDAIFFGIDRIATILNTGLSVPGVVINNLPDRVRRIFSKVDIIISKGQGNFETLSDSQREIYFLLTTKCDVVTRIINVPINSTVLFTGLEV